MNKNNIQDIYGLTPMQEGMLFHMLAHPQSEAYFEQVSCDLHGALDTDKFRLSWQEIVDRYPVFRTSFHWDGLDKPAQVVNKTAELPFETLDWTGLGEKEVAGKFETLLHADRQTGFNCEQAPLMRCILVATGAGSWKFIWSHHHMLMDGWCSGLILRELFKRYDAHVRGAAIHFDPVHPFRNYVTWLGRQDREKAMKFWAGELAGLDAPTPLGIGNASVSASGKERHTYDNHSFELPYSLSAELTEWAKSNGLTVNVVIQGAWSILLGKYSREEEVVFGATVSGRPPELPNVESIVGLFINSLPVRVSVAGRSDIVSWLRELQERNNERNQYAYTSLVDIKKASQIKGESALFHSLIVFENYPFDADAQQGLSGLEISNVTSFEETNYPITLLVVPRGDKLRFQISYFSGEFEAGQVSSMGDHLETIISGMLAHPSGKPSQVSLLTEDESEQVITALNQTAVPLNPKETVAGLIATQFLRNPENVAISAENKAVTYKTLAAQASAMRQVLISSGVVKGDVVAVLLENSVELIPAILGIWQAGACFLPLDAATPQHRVADIVRDSRAALVVTTDDRAALLSGVCRTITPGDAAELPVTVAHEPVTPGQDDAAYVIYTSGSTGVPKGVVVSHGSLYNYIQWADGYYFTGNESGGNMPLFTSPAFDLTLTSIFLPLSRGKAITIFGNTELGMIIEEIFKPGSSLDTVKLTPSHITLLEGIAPGNSALKSLIVGGEQLRDEHLAIVHSKWPGVTVFNEYGPTEATIGCTVAAVAAGNVHIGKPIANTRIYILDDALQPLPAGIKGEMYIGGQCLAKGYLGRPELTDARFVNCPFAEGEKMYRTGDVACWLPDGNIQYFGRADEQVKIRGFRIEPGEIEKRISAYPGVLDSAVLAAKNASGDPLLVAFVKVAQPDTFHVAGLKVALPQQLPAYMLPYHYVALADFPLTANGKTNRKELLAHFVSDEAGEKNYKAPANPLEEILASIWQQLLKVDRVGALDNFFEIGGHSLNATQMASRIRSVFKVNIGVKDVLEHQTIADLALLIGKLKLADVGFTAPPVERAAAGQPLQLSFAQQRLWFLDRLQGAGATYNIPEVLKLEGDLNITALEHAFSEIIKRHEALRTNFYDDGGVARLSVRPPHALHIPVVVADSEEEADRLLQEESVRPFDLETDLLIRVALFRVTPAIHLLSATMHHIVSDGWSSGVFVSELVDLYTAFVREAPSKLPPLPVQYSDFAAWQRKLNDQGIFAAQLSYWERKLAGAPFILDLPVDFARPAIRTENGSIHRFVISPQLSRTLRDASSKSGATLFMTLLSGYALLLSKYCRQSELLIGSSIANRNRLETEQLIGFFINVIVYRIDISKADTVKSLLEQVKQLAFEAYAHQDVPFDLVVDRIQPDRDMSYSPVFQVAFDMQNMPVPVFDLPGLRVTAQDMERNVAKYDLSLSMEDTPGGIRGLIEYNSDLFRASTIERFAGHYITVLEQIANAAQNLRTLSLLGKNDYRKIVYEWNKTEQPLPAGQTVLDIVTGVSRVSPGKAAVEFDGKVLSFGELEANAANVAHCLVSAGVQPGDRVGLVARKSFGLLPLILGIMKAGAAYIPLDPEYPAERISYMLSDSGAKCVLCEQLPDADYGLPVVMFADEKFDDHAQLPAVSPASIAYIIYTSGSTGRPKGVMLRHDGLLNLAIEQGKSFGVTGDSRTLQFASLSFDASVSEIFVALCAGSTVVMAPKQQALPGPDLLHLLESANITHATLPPSVLRATPGKGLPKLKVVVSAGEACTQEIVDEWGKDRVFINAYGPTECTVCGTLTAPCLPGGGPLTIGRPIGNAVAYILDESLNPLPPGVAGELFIGGAGVAAGYINLPEQNAQRFLADPFSKKEGARMYRTGDVAKYMPDGQIAFVGRADRQLKLRGFRIEPGEIEAAIARYPGAEQSVVELVTNENGNQSLYAFVKLTDSAAASEAEWWPSVAEFYVYDEFLYYTMTHDERRNEAYKKAIRASVKDKVVVEIGTGKDAILSRFCAEAGAARIYAIELNENTAKLARESVANAGFSDRITVIHGDGSKVDLPEQGDVCVSEIVGAIGGSEGAAVIINSSRRLLKEGGRMIPERSTTMMAACTLPQQMLDHPGFGKVPGRYTRAIFDQVGYPFDLRVCVRKSSEKNLLSSKDIFEDLDYTTHIDPETSHHFRLDILQDGKMDGLLVWLNLHTISGVVIDILEHEYCWLPVFLPVFYPGIEVVKGDYLTGVCTRKLCDNQLNPDFFLEGKLVRSNGDEISFSYNSYHYKQLYKQHPFYEKLFSSNEYGLLPQSSGAALQEFESFLKTQLPAYMVPNVVVVDDIPLTINGKVDRAALKATLREQRTPAQQVPGVLTEKEQQLISIWRDVLGIDHIGVNDNFFRLGGDSILSIQIVSRARAAGLEFTARDIFENQTVSLLASVAKEKVRPVGKQERLAGIVPLLPIQSWFFEQQFEQPDHFNQAVLLEAPAVISHEAIASAVHALADHHDILRARFYFDEGRGAWIQEIAREVPSGIFAEYDLSDLEAGQKEQQFLAIANTIQASLVIRDGILFKAALFTMGDGLPARLLFVIHHLVVDGVSWRILLEDFFNSLGGATHWHENNVLGTWAGALTHYAQHGIPQEEVAYWKNVTGNAINREPDHTAGGDPAGGTGIVLDAATTDILLKNAQPVLRADVQEILLAAFVFACSKWMGSSSVFIELEGHGRESLFPDIDISRTVGWFTAAYPVNFIMPQHTGTAGLLEAVKEQYRSIPGKGMGYGLLRYLSGERGHFAGRQSPELLFNYLGKTDSALSGHNGWKFSDADCGFEQSPANHRTHPLGINLIIIGGELRGGIGYDNTRFGAGTVGELASLFVSTLREIAGYCSKPDAAQLSLIDFPLLNISKNALSKLSGQIVDSGRSLAEVVDIYPLSPLQEGLLFESLLNADSVSYREQLSVIIKGMPDARLFREAWQRVIGRYDILRTAFFWEGVEHPVQVVFDNVEVRWNEVSLPFTGSGDTEVIRQFLDDDLRIPFSFTEAPLMRFSISRLPDSSWFFCWTHHHILMDGWCLPIIVKDVLEQYRALEAGTALQTGAPKPYADFIRWLSKRDEGDARNWWSGYLSGFHQPTPLPIDMVRSAAQGTGNMAEREVALDAKLEKELKQFSGEHGVTLNVLIQAAWSLLLSAYSGQKDVVFGATVAGRPADLDGVESMVGLFINSVPVRAVISDDKDVASWLQELQETQLQRDQHSYVSLSKIREYCHIDGRLPLFESLVIFENYPIDKSVESRAGSLSIETIRFFEQTHYPVTLMIVPAGQLTLRIAYDAAKFSAANIARMLRHLQNILHGFVGNGRKRLGGISLVSEQERLEVLHGFNNDKPVVVNPLNVPAAFAAAAGNHPEATAIIFEGEHYAYGEIEVRANQVTDYLTKKGIAAGCVVAVCLDRSPELVIALLGILKSGAAYLPLDPRFPMERLSYMVSDAGISLLLTQEKHRETWASEGVAACTIEEIFNSGIERNAAAAPVVAPGDLAYIIYTSGSTGKPKGVQIPHGALSNFLASMKQKPGFGAQDNLLSVTSVSFDIAGLELFLPLTSGGTLTLLPEDAAADAEKIIACIRAVQPTVMQATPTTWQMLVNSGWQGLAGMKMLCGGEALPNQLAIELASRGGSLWNMYGPTETTIWSAAMRVDVQRHLSPGGYVLIGCPVANTSLYILGADMAPVPVGVAGELYISGAGTAIGYKNLPELTKEKFVADPYANVAGTMMYRTGDMAKWMPDGAISFLGRSDFQVKIRGFRIETGEVEAVIREIKGVTEAAVVAGKDRSGTDCLIAFVAPAALSTSEITDVLRARLPSYMLPAAFVPMERLPVTPNGKTDRKALKFNWDEVADKKAHVPPAPGLQQKVHDIWASVLGIPELSIRDNFFEVGGHSILATQCMSRIRSEFGVDFPLKKIFDHPDIESFSAALQQFMDAGGAAEAEIAPGYDDSDVFEF